jgi:cellulose biosynthesis protein BcsQ
MSKITENMKIAEDNLVSAMKAQFYGIKKLEENNEKMQDLLDQFVLE